MVHTVVLRCSWSYGSLQSIGLSMPLVYLTAANGTMLLLQRVAKWARAY
jgi:hypothetical protein